MIQNDNTCFNISPQALQMVSRELGTEADYKIQASLYKLLLYEEGW